MAETLGVAGSAVGITSLGITVVKGLCDYYSSWKGCPVDVENSLCSLRGLERLLVQSEELVEAGDLDPKIRYLVKNAVASCEPSIKNLERKLDKIRRTPSNASFRSNAKYHTQRALFPFQEKTLAKIGDLISQIKANLTLAIGIANLYGNKFGS